MMHANDRCARWLMTGPVRSAVAKDAGQYEGLAVIARWQRARRNRAQARANRVEGDNVTPPRIRAAAEVVQAALDAGLPTDLAEQARETLAQEAARTTYIAVHEDGDSLAIEADDLGAALERAREWVREESPEQTIWVEVSLYEVAPGQTDDEALAGDSIDTRIIAVQPPEPPCAPDHEHDWRSPHSLLGGIEENPGVWGHGGGVKQTEVCGHCGAYRQTDTWATDHHGRQGLHSISYDEPDEASLAWVETQEEER